MSRGCLLKLAALLVCARAYEDSESNPGVILPGVEDDKNAATEVIGELGHPLKISCLASEKSPYFIVFWSHKTRSNTWLHKNSEYGMTGNDLLIRSLDTKTLGQYTCQVYSGGLEAPRVINVRAYRPDGLISGGDWLVPRDAGSPTTEDLGETDKLELELAASEGDKITLHCLSDSTLLAGDPLPKVTWKFGELTIDGTWGRYRVTSDGALQIVSLNRNDTGVYSCVPDNALGDASHEIHLLVNDPVTIPAGIAGEDNATVTGELYQPLHVRCLAYGYPNPYVLWTRDEGVGIVLYNNSIYEVTENVLVIRSLGVDTLGPYTCRAFNEAGKMASWGVVVQAYRPEGLISNGLWLVPRVTNAPKPTTQLSITTNNWLFTGSSTKSKFIEVTKEAVAPFDKSGGNTNNATSTTTTPTTSTTAVIDLTSNNTSEGNTTDEGSTTIEEPLDPCSGFQFGCCADNETVASGPDGQGCPCDITEFGCCPDGVNPASGRDNKGCPGPCSTTPYGCCQDGKTPAHGPEFEGCCLLQTFGCCPDNCKPAEGPHLEGCGCQYALYGCCPDNYTTAQGPDNQGCGCQYTQHGCCLDRHTPAAGPDNEGCACKTYQFGCCADGVTVAKGPDQQGCHCHASKFDCCGDGETAATGPDAAGCDCSSSRHGCCPDGRTEAAGPKFLGCTDAPENKQAACSLSTDPGPCHNFTSMWYYDVAYGGCSRFWYGGCDGNSNRFATKADCDDVCVQPSAKDACKLPSVKGACDGDYQRWHYNSTQEQCLLFRYGGCLGNANNFDTRELCLKQCEPSSVTSQCELPIDQGSCTGNYSRWGFNPEARRCEQFIWGGCEGNSNRFSSEAACQMRCAGTTPPQCTQPQEAGNCREKEAVWSFSQSENRCLPFYYSGCGGNDNRFGSREACEQTCPSAYVPDKCTLPAETGQCSDYREKWFYDTTLKRCRQFYYSGCGGNENNFATEAECEHSCSEMKTTTITTTTATATTTTTVRPDKTGSLVPEGSEVCSLTPELGDCSLTVKQWYYDATSDECYQFADKGCGSNNNRFETERDCEARCKRPASTTTTVAPRPHVTLTPQFQITKLPPKLECKTPSSLAPCGNNVTVFYYDSERGQCLASDFGGCGHANTYSTEEECERRCGAFRGIDVCGARLDPGPCRASFPKFYWDVTSGSCQSFAYGGCAGGPNRFSTVEECMDICGATGLDVPAAPQALPQPDPQVAASEGGTATLRCLFHGNPPPKITWRFGELTIDGTTGRYRVTSDGALQIVSLYRNDTGVYICVADYGLGEASQEIHLLVNDPVTTPVGISGDENAVVTGELGQPLQVRCLAYGYPPPAVYWYRGYDGTMVPYHDAVYDTKGNELLIRSLAIETLGAYTCQAYNGEGKPASWVVFVRAYMSEGIFIENEWLVPRNTSAAGPRKQPPTTTSTTTEAPRPMFTVPVSAHISNPLSPLNIGTELRLKCEIDGFPEPDANWTKDGVSIEPDDRVSITGSPVVSRLLVTRVTVADSGEYACHASNAYSSQSDTAQIKVQKLTIPATCTDNHFFANCDLIVLSKFCRSKYYRKFCCKSCVEAGQLDSLEVALDP